MPNRMPERMSDRMSEYMPERMSDRIYIYYIYTLYIYYNAIYPCIYSSKWYVINYVRNYVRIVSGWGSLEESVFFGGVQVAVLLLPKTVALLLPVAKVILQALEAQAAPTLDSGRHWTNLCVCASEHRVYQQNWMATLVGKMIIIQWF